MDLEKYNKHLDFLWDTYIEQKLIDKVDFSDFDEDEAEISEDYVDEYLEENVSL